MSAAPPPNLDAPSRRVTLAIARDLGRLVADLTARMAGEDDGEGDEDGLRERVARFAIACSFTLFAGDVGLSERWFRAGLGGRWRERPETFAPELRARWAAAAGSDAGRWLRGAPALALRPGELRALAGVAGHDWSLVDPAIFGGLLEQSLRAPERARLGAHFTPRAYIERIVRPTVLEPLRAQWQRVHAEALRLERAADGEGRPALARLLRTRARAGCRKFLGELETVRVLDPACGTGNFLIVAMDLFAELEREVREVLIALGEPIAAVGAVRPEQWCGIEKNPWSREIAELALWVCALQRSYRDGARPPYAPAVFSNLMVGDAILSDFESWPDVEFIVSNPPFIGNKRMRALLGDEYVETLREVYGEGLAGDGDYVVYWWHRAALRLRDAGARLRRFGFITTNSVRQRQSGAVLRRHLGDGRICLGFACPDHPWIDPGEELGSAAVRISMTVARRSDEAGAGPACFCVLDGEELRERRGVVINPDLTIGADLTTAVPLRANAGLCFQGMNLVGDGFRLSPAEVDALLGPGGPRPAALRRYVQGRDLRAAPCERFVIDMFGLDEGAARRAAPALFGHLRRLVQPLRATNGRASYARRWWLFGEPRPALRRALAGLERYIATPETSAHRFFVMLDADVVPDHQIYVIASADAFVLGVLSSRAHTAWALRAGGRNGAGNDPRWTSTATFLPFPFPDPPAALRREIAGTAGRLERARAEVLRSVHAASLTELYGLVERRRRGEEWSEAQGRRAAALRCEEVLELHEALDRAVLAAYGFPADIDDEALLVRLLALNHARAAAERDGESIQSRGGRSR